MLDKLRLVSEKYEELEQKMASPEIYNDPAAIGRLSREQKELMPIVEAYREYVRLEKNAAEALELINSESDPEFREMAQEEYREANTAMDQLKDEIASLVVLAAGKLLAEQVDEAQQKELMKKYIEKVGCVK